jgi:predicted hydrocarbon binding protein
MKLEHRPGEGAIVDGSIRYMLIRPDVLMGVAHHLGQGREHEFLAALEASAFANAQASFAAYRDRQQFGREDFLASTCGVANTLGWGSWSLTEEADGVRVIRVNDSPFAAGYGSSPRAVCAPIKGVLRACAVVGYGKDVEVEETECVAQGNKQCCFRIAPLK